MKTYHVDVFEHHKGKMTAFTDDTWDHVLETLHWFLWREPEKVGVTLVIYTREKGA